MTTTTTLCVARGGLSGERILVDADGLDLVHGSRVVVEAPSRGLELVTMICSMCGCGEAKASLPSSQDEAGDPKEKVRKAVRIATEEDLEQERKNQERADAAFLKARAKVVEHNLPMRLVKGEYQFDRSRLTFWFTAENRVDFRALVRDLAQEFKTRIELRQIGVRDEAKILDGYGSCGQRLCCRRWLPEFKPVSIKMAKEQSLPLSPQKISGVCGRLLCCLSYEVDQYKAMIREMPKTGTVIEYNGKKGKVVRLIPLKRAVEVQYEDGALELLEVYSPEEENTASSEPVRSSSKELESDMEEKMETEVIS